LIIKYEFFNYKASFFDKLFYWKIKEGLIQSVDYDIFSDKLKKLIDNYNTDYNIEQKDEYITLLINLENIDHKHFNNRLTEFINNTGYFKSVIIDIKDSIKVESILNSKNDKFLFYFQKKFDIPQNTPERLYHATTSYYYEKIKRTGLTTKSQKMISDDLERIYLTDDLSTATEFCTQKRIFYKTKYKNVDLFNMNIDKWVVLEIDIYSIPDIKLYKDEKMSYSYYTYDFIPFYSIKLIKEIDF
jgi:hypothetical protein